MILEILILIILATIVVILARKLPQTAQFSKPEIKQGEKETDLTKAEKFFEEKKFPQAEELYLKAATQDPDNSQIYNRLGVIYLDKRYYNDALAAFKEALRLDNKIASRHINVGVIYTKLGKHGLAARYFRNALKLDPDNRKYKQLLKNAEDKVQEKKEKR